MATAATDLAKKMRARAEADSLPADHPLRKLADEFDHVTLGYYAHPQTVAIRGFLGVWARARKGWCEYSGEPLI